MLVLFDSVVKTYLLQLLFAGFYLLPWIYRSAGAARAAWGVQKFSGSKSGNP